MRMAANALTCDACARREAVSAVRHADDTVRRLNILLETAAIGCFHALEESEKPKCGRLRDQRFRQAAMKRPVIPGMRKQRPGHIVNIVSMHGRKPRRARMSPRGDSVVMTGAAFAKMARDQ
jgi:NADP-dependent 3-hydroxy acid dehydrogenase YdfG